MLQMVGRKNGKYLEFFLDDGKTVKYDLSTGESIGTKGQVVNSISHKMKGLKIKDVISSIEDINYRRFLQFVYQRSDVCNVGNFGTLLMRASNYIGYEQYFSSGLTIVGYVPPFKECPPKLISICKKNDLAIDSNLIYNYKQCNYLFIKLLTSQSEILKGILFNGSLFRRLDELIKGYNYNCKSLLAYIERIYLYEGLDIYKSITTLSDYARMSSVISKKFEKYPKYLLSVHHMAVRNYNRLKEEYNEALFLKCIKPHLEFEYKDYVVIYPKSTQEIKDESVQQNNCVSSYIRKVLSNECDIVFLRKKDNPSKSLVTVEVVRYQVVQALKAYNDSPTDEQLEVLGKYKQFLSDISERLRKGA